MDSGLSLRASASSTTWSTVPRARPPRTSRRSDPPREDVAVRDLPDGRVVPPRPSAPRMARSIHSQAKRQREQRKALKRREKAERRQAWQTDGAPSPADPQAAPQSPSEPGATAPPPAPTEPD